MNVSMEFNKKQECLKYCELHKLAFWQRDINANSSKLFIADSYINIWNNIKELGPEKSYYYESWSAHTPMKLYIDYDKKNDDKKIYDEKNEGGSNSSLHNENSHKTDIVNIINAIVGTLPNITSISIMKSIPDIEKRSYHIIFEGMHFTKAKTIDTFMKEQIKPKFRELFDKKIIDERIGNIEERLSRKLTIKLNLNYLKQVIDLCEIHNVKLMLLLPPYHPDFYLFTNNEYDKEIKKYIKTIDLKSGNLLDSKSFNITEDIYFENVDHLNRKGAEIFSKKLAKDINQLFINE